MLPVFWLVPRGELDVDDRREARPVDDQRLLRRGRAREARDDRLVRRDGAVDRLQPGLVVGSDRALGDAARADRRAHRRRRRARPAAHGAVPEPQRVAELVRRDPLDVDLTARRAARSVRPGPVVAHHDVPAVVDRRLGVREDAAAARGRRPSSPCSRRRCRAPSSRPASRSRSSEPRARCRRPSRAPPSRSRAALRARRDRPLRPSRCCWPPRRSSC